MSAVFFIAFTLLITVGNGADESTVITDCVTEPKFPPDNSYVCYRTQIVKVGPFKKCTTERTISRNIPVFSQTSNYTIMYINSPGADQGIPYSNDLLCRWHIKCRDKQLLYFDIPEHSLEPMIDSSIFAKPVCVDYLKLYRDFGTQVTCGFKEPIGDMEPNQLLVEFRSNSKLRFPGFSMRLVCFDPDLQGEGGCATSGSSSRSKRATISSEINQLETNSVPGEAKNTDTALQKTIPSYADLRFQSGTLQILDNKGGAQTFNGIEYIVTYNEIKGVSFVSASNALVMLRGFGVLTVVNHTAYYTKFGIDPKFAPSPEEKNTIRHFLQEYTSFFSNNTSTIDDGSSQQLRNRRATSLSNPMPINAVTSSLNSCNAVLRSVAQSYFNLVSR
ncbi:hypothetical protein EMCRGX_G035050 [Ephydatia muelleri]